MTDASFDDVLRGFNRNAGASGQNVRAAEKGLNSHLPCDYVSFLLNSNGGQGMIGETYLILYRVEELVEMNAGYELQKIAPGLLLIGSDGGGEGFAFDTRSTPWAVVSIPFIGMEFEVAEVVGSSFEGFLRNLAR